MALQPDFALFSSLRYDPNLLQSPANASVSHKPDTPSPFYMLRFHRDRMLLAAEHFQWDKVVSRLSGDVGLRRLNQDLETEVKNWFASNNEQESESLKVCSERTPARYDNPLLTFILELQIRTLFIPTGVLTIELSSVPPVSLEQLFPTTLAPPSTLSVPPWLVHLDSRPTSPSPFTSFKTTSRDMYTTARSRAGIHSFQEAAEVVLVNPAGELMEGSLTSVYFFRDGKWVTPSIASGGQIGTTRRWLIEQGHCVEGVIEADSLQDREMCWISNGLRGLTLCKYISNRET